MNDVIPTYNFYNFLDFQLRPRLLYERSPHIMTQKQTQNWVLLSLSQLSKNQIHKVLNEQSNTQNLEASVTNMELKFEKWSQDNVPNARRYNICWRYVRVSA